MVSIVITCYNYGEYLARCVESALSQTYGDLEVIIVDDGSTDNTGEVVQKFLQDPRVRYIRQKNAGQANAKNTGIRAAAGEFIAFLDADDFWESDKLEKQMPLFSGPQVGVVYSRARYIDGSGLPVDVSPWGEHLLPRSGNVTGHLLFDNFIPFSSAVVRRECLDKAGVFDESIKMGIDWDLWLRISVNHAFACVDEPLLVYRVGHSGQMSKDLEERQRCSDRIIHKFLTAHPGLIPKRTIRHALAYTYSARGYYYAGNNVRQSLKYYIKSIINKPVSLMPYYGIIRLLCKQCMSGLRI